MLAAESLEFDCKYLGKFVFLTNRCSQWAPEGWLGKLGDGPLADAILDRIRNSSYTILLKGRSLREDYSKIK